MVNLSEVKKLCGKENHADAKWRREASYPIALILIKLHFTANQVSAFGLVLGMISCIFFITGNNIAFIIGGILLFLSQLMDYCDGDVARYRKIKGFKDEMWRDRGGAFDSLNHIAPTPALICMGIGLMENTNYPILVLLMGFLGGIFQFIRGGFFSYFSFILKLMNKKFADKEPKMIWPFVLFLPHHKLSFLVPHMMWISLIISISAFIGIFMNNDLMVITFIIVSLLIIIQGSIKLIARFPKIKK